MAFPDVALAPSPALTTNRPLMADPWDAPYFGGAVYLTYRPTSIPASLAAPVTTATTPATSAQPADPWDAPYFGGPVTFRYPEYPVALPALVTSVVTPPSAATTPDIAVTKIVEIPVAAPDSGESAPSAPSAPSAGRKSWLARLFGR